VFTFDGGDSMQHNRNYAVRGTAISAFKVTDGALEGLNRIKVSDSKGKRFSPTKVRHF
jgi:hypothetical protein